MRYAYGSHWNECAAGDSAGLDEDLEGKISAPAWSRNAAVNSQLVTALRADLAAWSNVQHACTLRQGFSTGVPRNFKSNLTATAAKSCLCLVRDMASAKLTSLIGCPDILNACLLLTALLQDTHSVLLLILCFSF
jgi:hypothetical protein